MFQATGGIEHAIAETAERVYAGLGEAGQREARVIFLRLVKIGASAAEDARRPVTRSDLIGGFGDGQAAAVVDAYTDSRLLTTSRNAVQITHEALLTAWPRLRGWLDEDRAGSLIRQGIEDAAADWARVGGDTSLLYRGGRLEAADTWASGRSRELTQAAQGFLAASRRLARRTTLIWRGVTAVLAVLALTASVSAVVAFQQQATANRQRAIADQRRNQAISERDLAASDALAAQSQATGDTDPVMARLEAVAAWRIRHTSRARYAMLSAALLPWTAVLGSADGARVTAVAFSPHGRLLAAGTSGGTIELCDLSSRKPTCKLFHGTIDRVRSVAFSRDGKLLAAGADNGTIRLVDVTSRKPAFTLFAGKDNLVNAVAFSRDGKLLAAGAFYGTELWNLASRTLKATLPAGKPNFVDSVAFSPDGRLLAVGTSYGAVQLWDVTSGTPKATPPVIVATSTLVDSVAFSRDGKLLAAGTFGGTELWNLASRKPAFTLPVGKDDRVASVAFSPDGKFLAADINSGTTQLWDLASRTLKATLPAGTSAFAESVAFSADSKLLATGTTIGIRLSDIASDSAISSPADSLPVGTAPGVWSLAFSPDGKLLAVGTDGSTELWNVASRTLKATLPAGKANVVLSVAFSREGKLLAVGTGHGTIQLWDVTTRKPTLAAALLAEKANLVSSVAFSADSKLLAAGTVGGVIQLWDVTVRKPTLAAALPMGKNDLAWSVVFRPDGKFLAAETQTDTIQLWEVATRHQVTTTPILAKSLSSITFSLDGTVLVIGSGEGVQLWDTGTSQQIGVLPVNSTDTFLRGGLMALSPAGTLLAVGTGKGTVQLWTVPYLTDTASYLCALAGQPFPPAQWPKYAPGLPYMATCP